MPMYEFQLILANVSAISDDLADDLFAAGCDDGTPFSCDGIAAIGFSREAATMEEAVRSAIADVEQAGVSVSRVESADESVFARINQELASH